MARTKLEVALPRRWRDVQAVAAKARRVAAAVPKEDRDVLVAAAQGQYSDEVAPRALPCTVPKLCFRLVSCEFASSSSCPVILVDHAAQDAALPDRLVDRDDHTGVVVGWMLIQALVRPVPVEVVLIVA